jgi:glucarate dehydratase
VIAGGKVAIKDGFVPIPEKSGVGVELDLDRLAKQHELFNSIEIRTRNDAGQMRKYDPDWAPKKPRY